MFLVTVIRELYFKIVFSILCVIGLMLVLQSSLNVLKIRSLAAEATSSRLQIAAAAIEDAIIRADSLGFSIEQMTGLQDLIDRERSRDDAIEQIIIVSPIGQPILASGFSDVFFNDREKVLRRVFGGGETLTRLDVGEKLYTGRLLFDSSSAVMGAIVLVTPAESFTVQVNAALQGMMRSYWMLFAIVVLLVVPFILNQFLSVGRAYRVLAHEVDGAVLPAALTTTEISKAISESNISFSQAEGELRKLTDGKSKPDGGS